MNKVYKVLSLSFLLCLSLVIAPFHISANGSLSAPFVGYNIFVYDYEKEVYVTKENVDFDFENMKLTCTNMLSSGGCNVYSSGSNVADITGNITYSNVQSEQSIYYTVQVILDETYVGYVRVTQGGTTRTYYINGNQFEFVSADNTAITISNYNLTKKSSVQSLEQIINLLTDIESEVDDIEPILNALLDKTEFRFPIESYPYVSYFMSLNKSPISFYEDSYYNYPVFELNTNDVVWNSNIESGVTYTLIFGIDKYLSSSNFDSYFTIPDGFSVEYNNISLIYLSDGHYGRIVKYNITNNNSSTTRLELKYIGSNTKIMPIFSRYASNKLVSTDFALQFGLNNQLLDDLHIIANGTSSSASSQSDLSQNTDDFASSSNQLVTQEDAFNNNMNSALQNINTNFDFNTTFGSKFIASANWVKTQYDRLTGSTPFGSVISFSLLLGLALLLVGKVLK